MAQCVTNRIGHVKLPHSPQIALVKTLAELSSKFVRKVLQKILAIFSPVILTASLVYLFTDLPLCNDHSRVDGGIYLILCCYYKGAYGDIDFFRIVLVFYKFVIHRYRPHF